MKRISSWDNLKFIAILCILILHSTIPYRNDGMALMKYIEPFINQYPMTLFTIISGFWYKDKSFKRLVLLFLWPCILFTIVNDILGVLFYPNYMHGFWFRPGYAMWYLMALFLYSIVTKLVKCYLGTNQYFLFALFVALSIGCIPISNKYFEIQRISCLFPCFAFGVLLKQYTGEQSLVVKLGRIISNIRLKCTILLVIIILCNIVIIYFYPEKQGAFKTYYGLDWKLALEKWMFMFMRVLASTCLILLAPPREYWFTKYGSRTMNVYLLHMIVIFPLSWGLFFDYRYEWYGVLSYFIFIPLLCTIFFSQQVDRIMKVLLLSKFIKK